MFTKKEIITYRSIKVPDELCKKIAKTQKRSDKKLYFISAVAACFIFIISGFLINNQSNIVINGQHLNESIVFYDTASSYGRNVSSSISVPVEIKASRTTKIKVKQGLLSISSSKPTEEVIISSSSVIWWEIELKDTDNVYEMKISDKKGVEKVTLRYDNAKITVTKEKEK